MIFEILTILKYWNFYNFLKKVKTEQNYDFKNNDPDMFEKKVYILIIITIFNFW